MSAEKNLSIGAIAQAAGIPVATLRTWERRYGFPEPVRLPSGHRRYSAAVVPKLVLMAEAKDIGLQPADTSQMSHDELFQHVRPSAKTQAGQCTTWLEQIRGMNDAVFDARLKREWTRLGAQGYVSEVIGPLLSMIGEAWTSGNLSLAEEHWASERIRHSLSSQWTTMSAQNSGPAYLCATLPGEQHDLGLQMAATILATHGARLVYLGSNTPVDAIADTVSHHPIECVCLSISAAAPPKRAADLVRSLREQLPPDIGLIVGGAGGVSADGVKRLSDWDDLVADVQMRVARKNW